MHFCNYTRLTAFRCKRRFLRIGTGAAVLSFVSERLVNSLRCKPLTSVCQRHIKNILRRCTEVRNGVRSLVLEVELLMQRTCGYSARWFGATLFRVLSLKICFPRWIARNWQVYFNYPAPTRPLSAPGWVELNWLTRAALGFRSRFLLLTLDFWQVDFAL